MKDYPDPHDHFEQQMRQAADRYAENLQRAELEPNPTLDFAVTERAIQQAYEQYQQEVLAIRDHNIDVIVKRHRRRMNTLKRSNHRLRLWTCPPIALVLFLVAWFSFRQPGGMPMGVAFTCGAVVFLAFVVGGAIFDRPTSSQETSQDMDLSSNTVRRAFPHEEDEQIHDTSPEE